MNNKSELRIWAKKFRSVLDIAKISEKICNNIRATNLYKNARSVMIFYPLKDEINLLPLLNDNKQFYLPRVNGNDLEVCPYKKGDELKLSKLKIKEPVGEAVDKSVLDLIFTPALCVDTNFYRLGYGKGFYDRFGIGIEDKMVAVIPEGLIIDKLPCDKYDIQCFGIISEKKASFRG